MANQTMTTDNDTTTTEKALWRPIPDKLRDDTSIPGDAIRLYALIVGWGGLNSDGCWASQDTIAEHFNWTVKTVRNYLAALEWADWITVQHRGKKQTGGRQSNLYHAYRDPSECMADRVLAGLARVSKQPKKRKGRAGVGGRKGNSSTDNLTTVNQSTDNPGYGNSSTDNEGNLNTANRESGKEKNNAHPEGVTLTEQGNGSEANEDHGYQPDLKQVGELKLKQPTDHQRRYSALIKGWNLSGKKLREKDKAMLGRAAKFLGGKAVAESNAEDADMLPGLNPPATPAEIIEFYERYWPWKSPDIAQNMPKDILKIQGWFLTMRTDSDWQAEKERLARREAARSGQAPAVPGPGSGQQSMIRRLRELTNGAES